MEFNSIHFEVEFEVKAGHPDPKVWKSFGNLKRLQLGFGENWPVVRAGT
jgi:hypothetical protein